MTRAVVAASAAAPSSERRFIKGPPEMSMVGLPVRVPRARGPAETARQTLLRRSIRVGVSDDLRLDDHSPKAPLPPKPESMEQKILRGEWQGSLEICSTESRKPGHSRAMRGLPSR